jgi:hypothetical protein
VPILRIILLAIPLILIVGAVALWLGAREAANTTKGAPAMTGAPTSVKVDDASPSAASSRSSSASAPSAKPSTAPASAEATAYTTPPGASSTPTPEPEKTGPGDVPDGWHKYQDGSGFSIALPKKWKRDRREGTQVYFRGPDSSMYLMIDQTSHPRSNAKKDWEKQEPLARGNFPGYKLIGIRAVDYWKTAADWEFTYRSGGGRSHVINRGFVTDKDHGYALYWKTSQKEWKKNRHLFDTFAATFRPAK